MFLNTLDVGGTTIDAARTAFRTKEMPPPAGSTKVFPRKKGRQPNQDQA
jgi:hypothetical protein